MRHISLSAVAALFLVGSFALAAEEQKPKNLAKPTNVVTNWRVEQHETGKADIAVDGDAVVITIKETTGTDWHVQVVQTGLDLADGKDYIVSFKAKASSDRMLPVNAMIDKEDWHMIGMTETAEITGEWKDFKFEFKTEGVVKDKNRISFILGGDKGKVWIKELSVTAK